jgi:hypothetical protein
VSIIQLTTEQPDVLPLAVEDIYTLTDMGTLEGNFLIKKVVDGKKLATFYIAPNKGERIELTQIYDLVRESITTEYDSKFDFPPSNENVKITAISGGGVLTLERRHTFEVGFRFVIGTTTYYVRTVPDEFSLTLSTTRGGSLYNNYAADGIVAGTFGTGYYDLVINNAVATRARPISQGVLVFAVKRVADGQLTSSLAEQDVQWMRTYNCSTTNTYNVISPAPEVRAFLNYGLR